MSATATEKLSTGTSRTLRSIANRLGLTVKGFELFDASDRDEYTVIGGDGYRVISVFVFRSTRTGRAFTEVYDLTPQRVFDATGTAHADGKPCKVTMAVARELLYAAFAASPDSVPDSLPATVAIAGTGEIVSLVDSAESVEQVQSIVYVTAHYYVGNLPHYLSGVVILALFASELADENGKAIRKAISRRVFDSPAYAHLLTVTKIERM